MKRIMVFLTLFIVAAPAFALTPQQAARADRLNREIRCVACQGQSIADSDADIAQDMRREIQAQIEAGQSDVTIRQGLLNRYGDYILFRPRFTWGNLLLWLIPPLLAVMGAIVWLLNAKTAIKSEVSGLTADEIETLETLLKANKNKTQK
jgi:cytochrome c-type biogenesis protein CcmH